MNPRTQRAGLVAITALGAFMLGCAPTKVDASPRLDQPVQQTAPAKEAKITAPVQLTFTSAGSAGAVVLTLSVRAQTDIPSGVARVILPRQIKVLSGQSEMPFGALPKDAERQFSLTVDASASGRFQIFAGVDCHISSGIQLHKEAQPLFIGQPPGSPN